MSEKKFFLWVAIIGNKEPKRPHEIDEKRNIFATQDGMHTIIYKAVEAAHMQEVHYLAYKEIDQNSRLYDRNNAIVSINICEIDHRRYMHIKDYGIDENRLKYFITEYAKDSVIDLKILIDPAYARFVKTKKNWFFAGAILGRVLSLPEIIRFAWNTRGYHIHCDQKGRPRWYGDYVKVEDRNGVHFNFADRNGKLLQKWRRYHLN